MSADLFRLARRGFRAAAVTLGCLAAAQSCGFPDHTFIDDADFARGKSKPDASTATGGSGTTPDASSSGGAGGATAGSGGTAGAGGTTTPLTGGAAGASGGTAGGDGGAVKGSGGGRTDGGLDAGPETGAPEAGLTCDPGKSPCSGACVDLLADLQNCGACGTACKVGEVCKAGTCSPPCDPGLTNCTGVCVDTAIDENNCSGCGKACPGGFVCEASKCVVDCGSLTRCGTQCYDLTTDDAHCGDCATNCKATGQVCSGGKCQASCSFPFVACGATCVNPQTDDLNCNGCGKACGTGQACINSVCTKLNENCQNGTDDDRDGLVDCADPDCTVGYTCAATPAGWNGPVALWTGTSGTAPACSSAGGYPTAAFDAHDGLVPPAPGCPSCNCTPTSATCNDIQSMWFDIKSDCSSTKSTATYYIDVPKSGACATAPYPIAGTADVAYFQSTVGGNPVPPIVGGGSCVANPPPPNFPDPSWTDDSRACTGGTTGGGCAVGQCFAKPKTPFGTSLCVYKAGENACPSGYPNQKPFQYQSWKEGRTCSCSCGSLSCGGTLTTYTDTACSVGGQDVPFDGTCTSIGKDPTTTLFGPDSRSMKWSGAGPVCGAVNGTFAGAPQPDGELTICCQ